MRRSTERSTEIIHTRSEKIGEKNTAKLDLIIISLI